MCCFITSIGQPWAAFEYSRATAKVLSELSLSLIKSLRIDFPKTGLMRLRVWTKVSSTLNASTITAIFIAKNYFRKFHFVRLTFQWKSCLIICGVQLLVVQLWQRVFLFGQVSCFSVLGVGRLIRMILYYWIRHSRCLGTSFSHLTADIFNFISEGWPS